MKLIFFVSFILFIFQVISIEHDCGVSPSHLQKLRNCCKLPNFIDRKLENICFEECKGKNTNCTIDCYFKDSKILFEGVLDRTVLRNVIAANNPTYKSSIPAAIDKCQFKEIGSLSQNVLNYFNCVYDMIALDCDDFVENPECEENKQQFEYCKVNCSMMPDLVQCCKPKLLSEDISNEYRQNQRRCRSELSKKLELDCIVKKRQNGECNSINKILKGKAENISRLFQNTSTFSENWETLIKKASGLCATKIKGFNVGSILEKKYFLIWTN